MTTATLVVRAMRPDEREAVRDLVRAAFAPYATLARPSGALAETVEDVHADLDAGGGLIAYDDLNP